MPSETTQQARERDVEWWGRWHLALGTTSELPAHPDDLIAWGRWLTVEHDAKPATVARRVQSLASKSLEAGLDPAVMRTAAYEEYMADLSSQIRAERQALEDCVGLNGALTFTRLQGTGELTPAQELCAILTLFLGASYCRQYSLQWSLSSRNKDGWVLVSADERHAPIVVPAELKSPVDVCSIVDAVYESRDIEGPGAHRVWRTRPHHARDVNELVKAGVLRKDRRENSAVHSVLVQTGKDAEVIRNPKLENALLGLLFLTQ